MKLIFMSATIRRTEQCLWYVILYRVIRMTNRNHGLGSVRKERGVFFTPPLDMMNGFGKKLNSTSSSNREYYEYYGLTPDKLDHANPDALIMHPGPMNRGIEIDTKLADDINRSVIKEQVELGVAVRMACLKIFCE